MSYFCRSTVRRAALLPPLLALWPALERPALAAAPAPQVDDDDDEPADEFFDDEPKVDPRVRLAQAYEGLFACLGGRGFEVKPRTGLDLASELDTHFGAGLTQMVREKAGEVDARMHAAALEIESWLPSIHDAARRTALLAEESKVDTLRAEALALIEVYERRDQNRVDTNRAKVEKAFEHYAEIVASEFSKFDALAPNDAAELLTLLRRGQQTLDLVDGVLADRGEAGFERADSLQVEGVFSRPGTFFAADCASVPEFAWLLLLTKCQCTVEVLRRIDPIQIRIDVAPTPFESWLLRELRARGVTRFNELAVHTGTKNDADFTPIINAYRRGLGLDLLTVDERLVIAARQHSQEQVDLDYFAHESPTARKVLPWDRVRLEDYDGSAAENLAQGRGGYKAASVFEGWYRSPGHHRNMVGQHHEIGAATDAAESIWTLLLGRGDTQWRDWHVDLLPARRLELNKEAISYARALSTNKIKERAFEKELVPLLPEIIDRVAAACLAAGASSDDGDRRHAIAAHERLIMCGASPRIVESVLLMQVLDIAVVSEDSGVRKDAEAMLRRVALGLAPELDMLHSEGGSWERVRVAYEDRERVVFKAGRPKS